MSHDQQGHAPLGPASFEGRLLIDIGAWDRKLRVAIDSAPRRPKARLQGLD